MMFSCFIIAMLAARVAGQDDGSFKCGCAGNVCKSTQSCSSANKCIDLPTQNWLADGACSDASGARSRV